MSVMTATTTATSFASRKRDLANQARSSQLERVVKVDESARWLPTLLSDLRSLEVSGTNMPGIGDFTVALSTADNVRRLLTVISGTCLPEPRLAPFSGGGIALCCSLGNSELTFTAYPGQTDFVYSRTNEDDELVDDGVVALEQAKLGSVIAAFLTR